MTNKTRIAAVAALALSLASVALTVDASAQSRHRGAPDYGYQAGEQNWLDRASQSREGGN